MLAKLIQKSTSSNISKAFKLSASYYLSSSSSDLNLIIFEKRHVHLFGVYCLTSITVQKDKGNLPWTYLQFGASNQQTAVRLIYSDGAWATCPSGTYLQGIYKGNDQWLHNIDQGKCCRPKGHPDRWGNCYDQDVSSSFDKQGWSNCSESYYMVGLYRGSCDFIQCIDTFKCCQMERK